MVPTLMDFARDAVVTTLLLCAPPFIAALVTGALAFPAFGIFSVPMSMPWIWIGCISPRCESMPSSSA